MYRVRDLVWIPRLHYNHFCRRPSFFRRMFGTFLENQLAASGFYLGHATLHQYQAAFATLAVVEFEVRSRVASDITLFHWG